jgi:hypothetical protein
MKRLLLAVSLAILLLLLAVTPALALDTPDSMTVVSAGVFRNCAEDGDMVVVFQYNIDYDDFPDDITATSSILLRFYSVDGLALLAAKSPYSFFNYGYGIGISGFYFSAAEAPVWGLAYKINVAGNPAFYSTLPSPAFYTLETTDYSTSDNKEQNQALLTSYILSCCEVIEQAYPAYILQGATDVGTVLTALGEVYIRAAVPGAATLAPQLFFTQLYTPEVIETDYSLDMAEEYSHGLDGTDLEVGFNRLGEYAGISGQTVAAIIIVIIAIGLIAFASYKGWGVEPGMIGAGIIISAGALVLGDAVFIMRIIMGFIGGLLVMNRLWLKKA